MEQTQTPELENKSLIEKLAQQNCAQQKRRSTDDEINHIHHVHFAGFGQASDHRQHDDAQHIIDHGRSNNNLSFARLELTQFRQHFRRDTNAGCRQGRPRKDRRNR